MAEMSRVQLIKEFFYRPGVDTTSTFLQEVKALTPEDRAELASAIAAQLGHTVKES